MPQTPSPNMGLILPTDKGDTDAWDALLDSVVDLIDAHDHTSGKGVQVPTAGVKIDADLSFTSAGGGHAAKDLLAVDFAPTAAGAITSYSSALFVNSSDNNLYFRNSGGVNVQITSGSTIDVSIVGGIGGDYTSVGALVSYDDATDRYLFQQQGSPRPWAGIACADIDLYQEAASITNRIKIKSPAALAASYTVTMPAAVPATTRLITMSSSGQLAFGTVSKILLIPPCAADLYSNIRDTTGTLGMLSIALGGGLGAAGKAAYPIPLVAGDTITQWRIYLKKTSDAANTITADLVDLASVAGTDSSLSTNATSANNPGATSLTNTGTFLLASGHSYWVAVGSTAGVADHVDLAYHCEITYTPAI